MAAEDPIHRGEFNAAMHGMRESIEGLKDGVTRVEAKLDLASTQALDTAREAGRTDARLTALEARAEREWQLWLGVVLAFVAAATPLLVHLFSR